LNHFIFEKKNREILEFKEYIRKLGINLNITNISQSKTLASDSGVIFSPPSIMREALDDSELYLNDDIICHREPSTKVNWQIFFLIFF
jgi:hypothetical protein